MNISKCSLWLFDVDNTLIRDVEHPEPYADALALIKALKERGKTVGLLTNVGRLSARQVRAAVVSAGFDIDISNVFTAGAAAAAYIANRQPNARCFVISEGGALEDFIARGLDVVTNPPVDYVAVGADRSLTFEKLNFAAKMLARGAKLLCISGSRSYPGVYLGREDVFIGERSIVAALEDSSGVKAVTVGKPLPEMLIEAARSLGFPPDQTVIVGDNVNSDIAGGKAAGMLTVLCPHDKSNVVEFDSGDLDTKPDIVVQSLDELIARI
ncbi:MAG: HAD hydrolase-like protein [Candidatus Thorarchaeota archaeon]|nr:HAD hydrolase-like protein [Candidatus Thorarchaeota archaeon]